MLFICKTPALSFLHKQLKFLFPLAIDAATITQIAITRLSSDGSHYKNMKIKQLIISPRGRGKLPKYKCILCFIIPHSTTLKAVSKLRVATLHHQGETF